MIEILSRIEMGDPDAYRSTVPALWYSAMAVRMELAITPFLDGARASATWA